VGLDIADGGDRRNSELAGLQFASLLTGGSGGRKGWSRSSHHIRVSVPGMCPHPTSQTPKVNFRTDFVETLIYRHDAGTWKGYTSSTNDELGTCYNASRSTQRAFQALTLRWDIPSVTSSSPRSINFVILPMAIVLPTHVSETVCCSGNGFTFVPECEPSELGIVHKPLHANESRSLNQSHDPLALLRELWWLL